MSSNRYNAWYRIANSETLFFLADYTPNLEECRLILLKVIEQAKRDLVNYADATVPVKREIWEEARQFLFDDDYRITWGDQEISLQHIGQLLGLEVQWMREKLMKEISKIVKRRKKYAEKEECWESCNNRETGHRKSNHTSQSRRKIQRRAGRYNKYRKGFRQGFNINP